jgi:CubicO group peptidase (beta-lactamase class C family)
LKSPGLLALIIILTACGVTAPSPTAVIPSATAVTAPPTTVTVVTVSTLAPVMKPTSTLPPAAIPSTPPKSTKLVQAWPTSTPEEQGMDSTKLAALLEALQKDERNIHSVLVARHGVMVLEAYFPPFDRETPHNIYSCTKSVTSAAVGLAVRDGLLENLDTPVYTYFPEISVDDAGKKTITLKHLLTMSSGLEWNEPLRSGLNDNWYIFDSESPAEYFFSRPTVTVPGRVFNYNTGGSHLLSMVVQDVAGETTASLVERELFTPLEISRYTWIEDTSGHTMGGTGLALTPGDMLKFGQLYLQYGLWGTDVVLTTNWVKESTSPHMNLAGGVNYGYQWWVRPNGIYNALGWGGQQIIVLPRQDMVVVFTAGIPNPSWNTYDDLLEKYLIPAAVSDKAIPPNLSDISALQEQLQAIANPPPKTPNALPPLAKEISGKTYIDLNGTHGWSTFAFTFNGTNEAGLDLMYGNKSEQIPARVGLDGLYRVTPTQNYGPIALKGYWKDGTTFVVTQQFLMEAERITMEMTFSGDKVKRVSRWTVENHREESDAVLLNK